MFFKLVEIYQNHRCLKLAYKGKTSKGSFAAILKDKLIKLLNLKPGLKPKLLVNK